MNKLILLFITAIITACTTKIEKGDVPKWYLLPPQDNIEKLYGVGVGSKEQAIKIALNNISEKILVTISSDYSQKVTEAKINELSEYESRVNQEITTNTLPIEYNGYHIEKIERNLDNNYLLLSVDRQDLANKYLLDIKNQHKEIENLYNSSKNISAIKKLIALNKTKPLIAEQKLKIKILNSLTKNNNSTDKYIDFYQEIKLKEEESKKKSIIQIIAKASDSRIANALSNSLNKSGFNVKYDSTQSSNNNIILRISTKTLHKEIYGSHVVKINLNLKLIENFGKQIAANNIEISGSSRLNSSAAIDSAIKDLNNKISDNNIFKILGI